MKVRQASTTTSERGAAQKANAQLSFCLRVTPVIENPKEAIQVYRKSFYFSLTGSTVQLTILTDIEKTSALQYSQYSEFCGEQGHKKKKKEKRHDKNTLVS